MRGMSSVAPAMFMAVVSAFPAIALTPGGDAWQVTFAPYLMGAAMSGTTTVKGQEVMVEA